MSIEFLTPEVDELTPRIAVIGVGGAGGNAIANMMRAEVQGVDFLVANTDAQALKQSIAPNRIQLGSRANTWLRDGGNADWVYGYDAWSAPLSAAPAPAPLPAG